MRILIASTDPDWSPPLASMLRERGFEVEEVDNVIDAMALLAEPTVAFVVHESVGPDESALAVRTVARRFHPRVRSVGVGTTPPPGAEWFAEPFAYVRLVEFVTEGLDDPNAITQPAPSDDHDEPALPSVTTLSDVGRLLHRARYEPYYELLGIPSEARGDEVAAAADRLAYVLDEGAVPPHVVDACYEELAEIRAAVADARAVLTSPDARRAYLRRLS